MAADEKMTNLMEANSMLVTAFQWMTGTNLWLATGVSFRQLFKAHDLLVNRRLAAQVHRYLDRLPICF